MGILIDIAYLFALILASPILVTKMIRHGRYRKGFAQRFGKIPKRYGLQPVIWIHAVSVGEVNATNTLIAKLTEALPDHEIVISSTTDTGFTRAKALYGKGLEVFYFPFDLSFVIAGAFGTYIDIASAIRIGMFPNLPEERFEQVGNAAGMGARLLLVSQTARRRAAEIVDEIQYVELTTYEGFRDEFIKQLSF